MFGYTQTGPAGMFRAEDAGSSMDNLRSHREYSLGMNHSQQAFTVGTFRIHATGSEHFDDRPGMQWYLTSSILLVVHAISVPPRSSSTHREPTIAEPLS